MDMGLQFPFQLILFVNLQDAFMYQYYQYWHQSHNKINCCMRLFGRINKLLTYSTGHEEIRLKRNRTFISQFVVMYLNHLDYLAKPNKLLCVSLFNWSPVRESNPFSCREKTFS